MEIKFDGKILFHQKVKICSYHAKCSYISPIFINTQILQVQISKLSQTNMAMKARRSLKDILLYTNFGTCVGKFHFPFCYAETAVLGNPGILGIYRKKVLKA